MFKYSKNLPYPVDIKKKDLKLPLTYVLYRILNKECSVQQALEEVMSL